MSGPELAAVAVVAVCLFTGGFVAGSRTASRLVVRRALSAESADVRLAGVRLAGHQGVAGHVRPLVQRSRVEQDRRVLSALADTVSAAPLSADDPPLLDELRLWARSYPDLGPARGHDATDGPSWVVPVALCNLAAVAGALAGRALAEGTAAPLAGSVVGAGGVLAAYAAARARGRRPADGAGFTRGLVRPGRVGGPTLVVAAPAGTEEPGALAVVADEAPGDDVIDLTAPTPRPPAGAGSVRGRSAAEAFWDTSVPDPAEAPRRRPAGGGRPASHSRRPGRE